MKKINVLMLMIIAVLSLTGCEENEGNVQEDVELTSISIEGAEDGVVLLNGTYNVLEGITVIGNNGVDYTDKLKVKSSFCGFDEDFNLYTQNKKNCDITYIAIVDGYYVSEYITVEIK